MTSLTRPTGHVTSFAYDSADRLTSLTQAFEGGVGNIAWTYAYTPASQVASSGASTSQFDWTGSPPSTINKAYDGLNRDATITALPGGYDANQNLTFDGTRTFAYDGDNRLVTESAAGTSTTLAYDPTGRLETQATTTGGTTTTTTYLYDGDNLAAEYDGSGNLLRRYAHGPGVDDPLIWYEGAVSAADARYLVADRQGSVIGYSDGGGTISAPGDVYTYDEYGAPGGWGGARFRYTGQIEIPELQLYDYKARMYDPITGRFLQTDPVGYKSDLDLYAYVQGDPLNHADPTGDIDQADWIDMEGDAIQIGWNLLADAEVAATDGGALAGPAEATVAEGNAEGSVLHAEAAELRAGEKTYQTYTKTNGETGEVYSGRTSGTGRPEQNVARRDSGHAEKNGQGYGPAKLDKSSTNSRAIRGREQQLIKNNGGAQSERGTSGNKINGVSPNNSNAGDYLKNALKEFGNLS